MSLLLLLNPLHRPYQSLLVVFILWKSLLLLLAVLSPGLGYDTSTNLAQLNKDITSADLNNPILTILNLVSTKLTRWDAMYYTKIASRGYIFEQEWAFGYGFAWLINFFANILRKLDTLDYPFRDSVVGIAISHAAHGLSVITLHSLACSIFPGPQSRKLAFVAACLHILSPAGVFLSAPCGESTYALLSFAGALLFVRSFNLSGASTGLQDALIVLAGIMYGLSTTVRNNGLLNGTIFLEEAIRLLYSIMQSITFAKCRRLSAVGIAGVCTGFGFVLPQYIAYQEFCVDHSSTHEEETRIWCRKTLPSIYSFVQTHYWNNGFLRYWTFPNIPLFILAGPMLAIMIYSAIWALNVGSSRSDLVKAQDLTVATIEQATPQAQLTRRLLRSLTAPQVTLVIWALTTSHVQIITRISSGYPVWYFCIATLLVENNPVVSLRKGASQDKKLVGTGRPLLHVSIVVRYMVIYAIVQGGLFASFLPPA